MLVRYVISICLITGMLAAADLGPKLTPPALGKLSHDQFQKMLFRALDAPPPKMALELGQISNQQHQCAIPLLESKEAHPERYSMPHMPVVGGLVDAIGILPPIAACPHWNADK